MKSWELQYHFPNNVHKTHTLRALTGDTEPEAIAFLLTTARRDHPDETELVLRYAEPVRKPAVTEHHCGFCGSRYTREVQEGRSLPKGALEGDSDVWRKYTLREGGAVGVPFTCKGRLFVAVPSTCDGCGSCEGVGAHELCDALPECKSWDRTDETEVVFHEVKV